MFGHFVIYTSIIIAKILCFGEVFWQNPNQVSQGQVSFLSFFIIVFKGSLILKELSLTHCFMKGLIPDLFLLLLK